MANEAKTFNIEEMFDQFAEASALAEASAYPTVSTGAYRVQVQKVEGKEFANEPGRPYAHMQVAIYDEGGQKKLSTAFVDASWVMKRDDYGKPDRGFKYWDQITKALYPDLNPEERSKKDVGTVLKDVQTYPMSAFILEKFKVKKQDGTEKWTSVKSTEQDLAVEYRKAGFRAINTISNFSLLK